MKYTIIILTLSFTLSATTAFAQDAEPLPSWEFGDTSVTRIEDKAPGFTPDIFPTVDKATFDKYAVDGKMPSSVSAFCSPDLKGGYVLFDAALGAPDGKLVENLEKAMGGKYEPEKVRHVFLTHMHGDHIGGLMDGDARRFPNAKVYCSEPEAEYWSTQNNAMVEKVKKAYGKDFRTFPFRESFYFIDKTKTKTPGKQPPVVEVIGLDAAGHTPGHTVYYIGAGNGVFIILGDLLHAAALQFPHPEICAKYDMDPEEAVKSRRRILDMAAKHNIPVAGAHIPAPGMGFVKKNADGGYEFTPINAVAK